VAEQQPGPDRPDGTTSPTPSMEVSTAIALAERLVYAHRYPVGNEVDEGALMAYLAGLDVEQLAHVETVAAALVCATAVIAAVQEEATRG
jgi:hypothetical protein